MHRSASWNRFSDDYFKQVTSSIPSNNSGRRSTSLFDGNNVPSYNDPIVELAKRERARVKFAENAVHIIPLVLILCAIILWIFSNPDVGSIGDPIGGRIEGLSLEGEIENDSDGTQTGFLPLVNSEDTAKELEAEKVDINLKNF